MGFWGIEVKPGKPHPYHSDNVEGTLYVTQATLGLGSSTEKCILQCAVGHKNPIFLCSLLPDRTESCSLNLEFKDELVAFSVIGPRSIHLSGYFVSNEGDDLRDEYEFDSGESLSNSESEDSSEFDYDDEYDDDFIDDDDDMFCPSHVPNSGVVIEEIEEDEKPPTGNGQSKQSKKKKNHPNKQDDLKNSQKQLVIKKGTGGSVLESEDEDGFPITSSQKSKATVEKAGAEEDLGKDTKTEETKKKKGGDSDDATGKKRKVKSSEEDGQQIRKKKEKLKEKLDKGSNDGLTGVGKNDNLTNGGIQQEEKKEEPHDPNENKQKELVTDANSEPGGSTPDKKKKKKKNKKNQANGEDMSKNATVLASKGESNSSSGSENKASASKSSKVRTFANGLVVEDIAMGKPDGKKASPGSSVTVRYTGKLQKNGKIFDSNVGRAPFKFRLGVGQVIKGWDVGVNGMRIGDKRRLTIPPAMGYGDQGAGGKIPPNAWLVFDVELLNVK